MHRNTEVLQYRAFGQTQFVGQMSEHAFRQDGTFSKGAAPLAVNLAVLTHVREAAAALAAIAAIDERIVDNAIAGLELLDLTAHFDDGAYCFMAQDRRQLKGLVVRR